MNGGGFVDLSAVNQTSARDSSLKYPAAPPWPHEGESSTVNRKTDLLSDDISFTVNTHSEGSRVSQGIPLTEQHKADSTYADFLTYFAESNNKRQVENLQSNFEPERPPREVDNYSMVQNHENLPLIHGSLTRSDERNTESPAPVFSVFSQQNVSMAEYHSVQPKEDVHSRSNDQCSISPLVSIAPMEESEQSHTDIDPPLLEELGIDVNSITCKALAVLNPLRRIENGANALSEIDFAGPLVLIFIIAFMQTLVGKVHYGFLYGLCTFGSLSVHGVLAMLPQKQSSREQSLMFTLSILGYCLLPVTFLSITNVLFTLFHTRLTHFVLHWLMTPFAVIWASFCGTKMFVSESQHNSCYCAVMYPLILLYAVFSYAVIY
ncbi:protein YIPF5-like protein [Perkinsela sp. CCAP 1560/4]|nr:protein YIPF5-like protein [Perkinsela sp. CCAP 1560/4]|eukprot:KNH07773.1 protein YIPF5-like protein [Perkinsela sp. CCAP 1560/4]